MHFHLEFCIFSFVSVRDYSLSFQPVVQKSVKWEWGNAFIYPIYSTKDVLLMHLFPNMSKARKQLHCSSSIHDFQIFLEKNQLHVAVSLCDWHLRLETWRSGVQTLLNKGICLICKHKFHSQQNKLDVASCAFIYGNGYAWLKSAMPCVSFLSRHSKQEQ